MIRSSYSNHRLNSTRYQQYVNPNSLYDSDCISKHPRRSAVRGIRTLTRLDGGKGTSSAWGTRAFQSNMIKSSAKSLPKPVQTSSLRSEGILASNRNHEKKITWGSALTAKPWVDIDSAVKTETSASSSSVTNVEKTSSNDNQQSQPILVTMDVAKVEKNTIEERQLKSDERNMEDNGQRQIKDNKKVHEKKHPNTASYSSSTTYAEACIDAKARAINISHCQSDDPLNLLRETATTVNNTSKTDNESQIKPTSNASNVKTEWSRDHPKCYGNPVNKSNPNRSYLWCYNSENRDEDNSWKDNITRDAQRVIQHDKIFYSADKNNEYCRSYKQRSTSDPSVSSKDGYSTVENEAVSPNRSSLDMVSSNSQGHRMLYEPVKNSMVPVDINKESIFLGDDRLKFQKQKQQQMVLEEVAKATKSKRERKKAKKKSRKEDIKVEKQSPAIVLSKAPVPKAVGQRISCRKPRTKGLLFQRTEDGKLIKADLSKNHLTSIFDTNNKSGKKNSRKWRNEKKRRSLPNEAEIEPEKIQSKETHLENFFTCDIFSSTPINLSNSPLKMGIDVNNYNYSSNESVSTHGSGDFDELVCCGTAIHTLPLDLFESDSDEETFHDCCNH